jgi:hypothetical protein
MAFDVTSEVFPARTQLMGQGVVVLKEGETLVISANDESILKASVPKGKTWKLTLSIAGSEEDA